MSAEAGRVVDLSRALLADEIRRVRRERWSGVFALAQGQVAKRLVFVDGEIAFAGSTVEEDMLGANLFRAGKITEAQFRAAMRASEGPGRHIGDALTRAGVLTAQELALAVSAQFERIVLSLLRWTSGTLRQEPLSGPHPGDVAVGLDTRVLLLVGMRQFPDAGRLEAALGHPARQLRRVSPPPFDVERVPPSPAERAVLALCRRSASVLRLLSLPHGRPEVVRAIHGLLASGLLEEERY